MREAAARSPPAPGVHRALTPSKGAWAFSTRRPTRRARSGCRCRGGPPSNAPQKRETVSNPAAAMRRRDSSKGRSYPKYAKMPQPVMRNPPVNTPDGGRRPDSIRKRTYFIRNLRKLQLDIRERAWYNKRVHTVIDERGRRLLRGKWGGSLLAVLLAAGSYWGWRGAARTRRWARASASR